MDWSISHKDLEVNIDNKFFCNSFLLLINQQDKVNGIEKALCGVSVGRLAVSCQLLPFFFPMSSTADTISGH